MKIASTQIERKQLASLSVGHANRFNTHDAEMNGMVSFAEKALGWILEDKQRELLTGPSKRVILNCTRQWGKSWMAAVALLFHAVQHPQSMSIVAGPTLRQSGELVKKVKDLAWRMGLPAKGDGIRVIFDFRFAICDCSLISD